MNEEKQLNSPRLPSQPHSVQNSTFYNAKRTRLIKVGTLSPEIPSFLFPATKHRSNIKKKKKRSTRKKTFSSAIA